MKKNVLKKTSAFTLGILAGIILEQLLGGSIMLLVIFAGVLLTAVIMLAFD